MKTTITGGSKLLFLVLCLNVRHEVKSCPDVCGCYSEPRTTVSCQQLGLAAIPSGIPIRSQRIFLQNNKITFVKSTSFSNCHNLTVLWLHSNNISIIEPGAFYGLERLEELDLSDNANLKSISSSTFRGLTRLHTLHLHKCSLSDLIIGTFHGLFSLQYLYLQDNKIDNLSDDLFIELANLTYLFLYGNKLKMVSENVFRGLVSLDRLLLHQNKINQIHPRAFRDLGKLVTLYLFNNNLTVLTGEIMSHLVSLQYLRLNGNQWICDCRARSLWEWFKNFRGSSSELECHAPAALFGRDLKRLQISDLNGCLDASNQIRTSIFSTKTKSGKVPTAEAPLMAKNGSQRCCHSETDKSSMIYDTKVKSDPSSYNSRISPNNPLKAKGNISKIKYSENDPSKNGTVKQRLNDAPVGTFSNNEDQSLSKLKTEFTENFEHSTPPSRKKTKCLKKTKSNSQCRLSQQGNSSAVQHNIGLMFSLLWLSLTFS
ncbi:reticulon-4 receptor-like [Protopterus annectens]|uniref:reticulon-4 receptor-like n=1 Tax=Protopterus annectens TaxID=7888 RepID=UPI001CF93971|nr:reticulon-4 receptor-like [Protopterus annectens]